MASLSRTVRLLLAGLALALILSSLALRWFNRGGRPRHAARPAEKPLSTTTRTGPPGAPLSRASGAVGLLELSRPTHAVAVCLPHADPPVRG